MGWEGGATPSVVLLSMRIRLVIFHSGSLSTKPRERGLAGACFEPIGTDYL